MRKAVLVLASLGALAACNPSAPGDSGAGGLFPNLFQTAYRAEAVATGPDGATMPVVMIRDGRKMRIEMSTPEGPVAIITNGDTGESFIVTTQGGQTMAMRATGGPGQELPVDDWSEELSQSATRTGSCSAAGQSGGEWTSQQDGETNTACVTNDGIILRATEGGRTTWETTSVQRGPQSPALFALPEGAQVLDLGAMMSGQ